jgi:hypothetical protein
MTTGIVVFPATTNQNQIAWQGVPNSSDTVLFQNTDLNNTAYLGYTPNLIPNVNSIPVAPNGNIVLPANRSIYAIWSTSTGVSPLVIIPGGVAYFLGITQGLGNLAIPAIRSPNFVHGVSGWQIAKDGSAEFNNLTIRGTFFGLDFIINSNGAFFYNGTPALGNLKISIVSNGGGVDSFGNVYLDNMTTYNVANANGGYAQLASNPSTGIPFVVLFPPGPVTHMSAPPQVNAGSINPGAANEQTQANINSGFETAQGAASAAVVQVASRSNDGTVASVANLIADVSETTLVDGNIYRLGQKKYTASNIPVASTTPVTLLTVGPLAAGGVYHIHGFATYLGNQAAGAPIFSWGASGGLVLGATQDGWQDFEGGGVAPIIHNNLGALGAVTGPVFAAATTNWLYRFDIEVNVTTTGSLVINAAENTAGDSFAVGRVYAWLEPN